MTPPLLVAEVEALVQPYQPAGPLAMTPADALRLLLTLVETLSEQHVSHDAARYLARFLTPEEYANVVQERTINHVCGYFCCDNAPRDRHNVPQIHFRRPLMVLPYTYYLSYCCRLHYQLSAFYERQLLPEALFARPALVLQTPYGAHPVEQEVRLLDALVEHQEALRAQDSQRVMELILQVDRMAIADDGSEDKLAKYFELIKIVERNGNVVV